MRACLLLCAALALAPSRPRAAAERPSPPGPEPARLEHIKTQILAKLGLSSRPTPLGAPPRDVVRQILARAADPLPERRPEPEHSMREIIAIAHRGYSLVPGWHEFGRNDNMELYHNCAGSIEVLNHESCVTQEKTAVLKDKLR